MGKKIASVIGIILGIVIIIVGFSVMGTETYHMGDYMKFGADFYTEMYSVTRNVGRGLNYAINDLICAVGWLIVAIGLVDVAYFICKLCSGNNVVVQEAVNAAPVAAPVYSTQSAVVTTSAPTSAPVAAPAAPAAPVMVSEPVPNGWTCTCGRNHAPYEMSCTCGMTKAQAKLQSAQKD